MAAPLTPADRVYRALRGEPVDKVPFTMYKAKVPQCAAEREMRNRGLCILEKAGVIKCHQPNTRVRSETFPENGRQLIRTWVETPVGTVTRLTEPAGFTSWTHERFFKGPEDYKILRAYFEDMRFEENYAAFAAAEKAFGPDAVFRAQIGSEPLQTLISGCVMDMETFCYEWMDRRDEILKLYEILVEQRRKCYPIVANSPARHANYGGNVVPAIISPEMFREYYLPHYNEAAEALGKKGVLVGCHLDDNCGPLKDLIAESDLDYIEAFTPAPDTDMTLREARDAWPDKALWLNFPSSVHLRPDAEVTRITVEMLESLENTDGILMGITEDIPPDRWQDSCRAIMDGLDRAAERSPLAASA